MMLSMDLDLWMRMMHEGARVVHIPKYLGIFRWHESSKTIVSLESRKTKENPETTVILNTSLKNSSPSKREIWRYVYKLYQIINLNYFRKYCDWLPIKGKTWKEALRFHK